MATFEMDSPDTIRSDNKLRANDIFQNYVDVAWTSSS